MLKKMSYVLAAVALLAFLAAPVQAQSVDEVLAKMIDAAGGRKAMEAVKDSTMIATMEIPTMNMSGTMTLYQKEPDKMKMDMEMMGMKITQAYDGKIGWGVNPQTGKAEEAPAKAQGELKRMAQGYDAMLNPQKHGLSYVLKGKEKIADKDCFVLEQTTTGEEEKTTIFVDGATYLPLMSRAKTQNMMGADVDSETLFEDYKKEGNVIIAHSLTIKQGGAVWAKIKVSEITFNSDLEDAFFKM
jgi:outer membrane lipoprotein-sorting protein